MANKVRSLLGGPGFYAVLALCIVAAGVGGYFLLLREDPQAADTAVVVNAEVNRLCLAQRQHV